MTIHIGDTVQPTRHIFLPFRVATVTHAWRARGVRWLQAGGTVFPAWKVEKVH
jgi:hypothetical protein